MFLQKQVSFLPLPPKHNNSPACRPKTSKRCHTQQQNLQQRISVAVLIGHSSYLLPSPPRQIFQLAHPPLIAPSHPSCSVGCCVIFWCPPSASLPAPPPLVVHASARCCRLLLRRGAPLVWLVVIMPDGLPPPLSRRLRLSSFVGCRVALHRFALLGASALLPLSSHLCFLLRPYNLVGCHVALTGALASLPLSSRLRPAPPPLVAPSRPPCLVGCHVDRRTGLLHI
jgi:hypothetical protein